MSGKNTIENSSVYNFTENIKPHSNRNIPTRAGGHLSKEIPTLDTIVNAYKGEDDLRIDGL